MTFINRGGQLVITRDERRNEASQAFINRGAQHNTMVKQPMTNNNTNDTAQTEQFRIEQAETLDIKNEDGKTTLTVKTGEPSMEQVVIEGDFDVMTDSLISEEDKELLAAEINDKLVKARRSPEVQLVYRIYNKVFG